MYIRNILKPRVVYLHLHCCSVSTVLLKIPERPSSERSVVYSPAKPIDLAWEECKEKGLMVVSQVFSKDVMR